MHQTPSVKIAKARSGFRGGGGRTPPPPSGIRPPADPKGPPFDTFSEINFWRTEPKIFLKAPLAPIYTNFEGERAPKKNSIFFLSKFFKKCPKTAFLTVFSKICLRRRKCCQNRQNRGKTLLWESSKNQFGRPKKKKVVKILENFSKIRPPPPLEKILDPPLAKALTIFRKNSQQTGGKDSINNKKQKEKRTCFFK